MRLSRALLLACLVLCAAVAAALSGCGGDPSVSGTGSASASPDPVVARIDGRPVHRSAVDAVRAEFRLGGGKDTEARAREEAVRRELLRREAERLGVQADPMDVEARRAVLAGQAGGEDGLKAVLERAGMTEAQLRLDLEDGVLHQALQDAKFASLAVTSAEARAYYDEHRASFRQAASAHLWSIQVAAERIAESALGRLRSGHPFEEVARQFSTDAQAKAEGGDMGTVTLASLPPTLRKAVESVKEGVVTGPVQAPGGWYVLKATDIRPAGTLAFGEVKGQIVRELTRERRFKALEEWLDQARDKATVTGP
jgi:parvulin-like peptidyl-prolyl isomerase